MRRMISMQTLFIVILIIQISVTFGEEDPCEECITIEDTPGIEIDQDLLGSYKLRENSKDYDCPRGCAYKKENDEDDSVWCFKREGEYKYSEKCPSSTSEAPVLMSTSTTSGETAISMTSTSSTSSVEFSSPAPSTTEEITQASSSETPSSPASTSSPPSTPVSTSGSPSTPASTASPPTSPASTSSATTTASPTPAGPEIKTKTIFIEGDTVVEQEDSFDPTTGDIAVKVPAHGNNVAVTVLIGGQSNTRSSSFGMVTAFDDYCLAGPAPENISTSAYNSPGESDEFTNSTKKSHYLNVIDGDLTEAERNSLPESFRIACKDKPIKKGRRVLVTENSFDEETFDHVENGQRILLRDGTCGNQKTSCSKFDRGCYFYWSNPSGGGNVQVHSISYTLQCLSCCVGESTSKLCQCSNIKDGRKWKECYKKTNGACDFKGWKCNSTNECLKYSEQCDDKCYGSLEKCGDSCVVPKTDTPSSFQYSCQDKCVNSSVICEGKCPEGTSLCGFSCVPNRYKHNYVVCDGSCQPRYKKCDGVLTCPEGTLNCDGSCLTPDRYIFCNGKCQPKYKPCQGVCLQKGYIDCNGFCRDERYWKLCNGKCQWYSNPCDGKCPEGYLNCNGRCTSDKWTWLCNGKCLSNSQQCDGKCREGYIPCNGRCYKEEYWKECNGGCIWKTQSCPSPGIVTTRSTYLPTVLPPMLFKKSDSSSNNNIIARNRMLLQSKKNQI